MDKLERIACLYLTFLNCPGGISFARLKKLMPLAYQGEQGTARRKFERDKEELKKMGLELKYDQYETGQGQKSFDRGGVYVPVEEVRRLPDIALHEADYRRLAVLLLKAVADQKRDAKERQLLQRAATKLFYKNPMYMQENIEDKWKHSKFLLDTEKTEKFLKVVHDALKRHKVLKINYSNKKEEKEDRLLSSRGLISHKGRWCLIAYCHTTRALRNFYVDRIMSAELSDERVYHFDPSFDIRKYSLHSLTLGIHPPQRVRLRVLADYEESFRDFLRAARKALPYYAENENVFHFDTSNVEALFSWMIRHSGAVERLGPQEVQTGFANYIEKIKASYNRDRKGSEGSLSGDMVN